MIPQANASNDRRLVLVLGDQLSVSLSSLKAADPARDIILMAEVIEEASYVRHHKKKIAFLFSAMRHFAKGLEEHGWTVRYVRLDDTNNAGSLTGEVERALQDLQLSAVLMTEPGEYRLKAAFTDWASQADANLFVLEDTRFIASHTEFQAWASGRKQLRMEYFYRHMRRKTGLLMDGDKPEGGTWNYDSENRKPASADLFMPQPHHVAPDAITKDVLALVSDRFADNFGTLDRFFFAVNADGALEALKGFIDHALPHFGDFQDAMLEGQSFLYHSLLGLYINAGLLDPLNVCKCVEAAYYRGDAPLNAVEGYIRQIIGWREFVRGIYWWEMPGYTERNFLDAKRALPAYFWTGETQMACVHAVVEQTRDEAYAHHIQRLMVTGNFAMLAGIDPHEVHKWYLAVYADAYEWVEAPNVIGMSQFADGGILGSKPYASSGNYIHKMSDYCDRCAYNVKQRTSEEACPFNPLYWDFMIRNREKLGANPRLGPVYRTWDRMDESKRQAYLQSAQRVLDRLEEL